MRRRRPTPPDAEDIASELFREVVRRGIVAVREDLDEIEGDLAGITRIEIGRLPHARPAKRSRSLNRPDEARPILERKALPAPKPPSTSAKRWDAYVKPSPLRDGIAEVLRRASTALTPCEIAERLRSRAFGYDPGQASDKKLRTRVITCLQQNKTKLFESAGHGIGWCLREGK